MKIEDLFKDYISYTGTTRDDSFWRDSSTMMPVNFPNKRSGKAQKTFKGRVTEVKERIFTAEISNAKDMYSVSILKDKLSDQQKDILAVGMELSYTIYNDYSNDRKRLKSEINLHPRVLVNDEVLRKKIAESIAKYRHFFEND